MLEISENALYLSGPKGSLPVREDDEVTIRLAMLYEAECEGRSREEVARKFGYTRQRYYQILDAYAEHGAAGLKSSKRGPKQNYRRTDEVVREVIRHRFLDPKSSAEVITQKIRQAGHYISTRSVERVITEYGLQKKTPPPSP